MFDNSENQFDPKAFELAQNFKYGLVNLKNNFQTLEEWAKIIARLKKVFYEECIKSGFTVDEALKLTIAYRPLSIS